MADGDGAAVDVDLGASSPSSRSTAMYCAPNASLISKRSMSSSFRPALASTARIAGAGPIPMISGGTPTVAPATMRASGLPPLLPTRRCATTTAAAPSTMAELLPPVCTPLNAGLSALSASSGVGRGCVVGLHRLHPARQPDLARLVALAARTARRRQRHHLALEVPGLPRRHRAIEAGGRERIRILARDLVALGQLLRRVAHARLGRGVQRRLPQEVLELDLAHPEAAAMRVGGDRIARHGFGADAQHRVRLAERQLVGRLQDRLEARRCTAAAPPAPARRSARRHKARCGAPEKRRRSWSAPRRPPPPRRSCPGAAFVAFSASRAALMPRSVADTSRSVPL